MKTSVESFVIGLAAFVVPFMFFYSPAMLLRGEWLEIIHVFATAMIGIYLLAAAVQGWLFGPLNIALRLLLLGAALAMIKGGWVSDAVGLCTMALVILIQKKFITARTLARGAD